MKIAIISYAENNSATKSIRNAIENKGHEAIVLNPNDLAMVISNRIGYDRLYGKSNKKDLERIYANDIDSIIPRIGTNIIYASTIIDHLNLNLGIFSTQTGEGLRIASNKLLTLQKCSQQGIPTPLTVYANDPTMIDQYIDMVGGTPLIVKGLSGSRGDTVILLTSHISAKSTIQALFKQNSSILIQEFIDSKGSDLRGIVVGEQVVASYKRQAQKGDFRANINKGASAISVELTQEEKDYIIKASKVLNLSTSGVDFIRDSEGKFRLIEVNGNYGLHIQQVTGVDVSELLVDYISCEKIFQKQKQIDFPTKKDLLLRFQESQIDKFLNELELQKNQLNDLLKNEQLISYFKQVKGKEIQYTDNKQMDKILTINEPSDLYRIMLNMFQLN